MRLPPAFRLGAVVVAITLVAYGCSDAGSPTDPTVAAGPSLSEVLADSTSVATTPTGDSSAAGGMLTDALSEQLSLPRAPVLRRNKRLTKQLYAYTLLKPSKKTTTVTLKIRELGLAVHFPGNAVKAPTWVAVVADTGEYVSYTFWPHGIQFDTLVKIQQDLKYTEAYSDRELQSTLHGGYLANGLADIDADGIATITEVLPIYYNESDPTGQEKLTPSVAKFYTNHFSGYIIATGRRGALTEQ